MAFGSFIPLLLVGRESFIVCLSCKFACPLEKCFFLLKVTYEICHCQLYSKRILDTRSFLFALPLQWEQAVIGVHIRPGGLSPLNSKICSMSIPFTVANFFSKVFWCIKTGEVEVHCYWKMYNRWLHPLTIACYCRCRIYIELGPWYFAIFAIFSCQIQKTNKSLIWARRHWHCAICQIRPWLFTFIKRLHEDWGPELANFRIKTLHFTRVIRLNWLANIKLKGSGPLGAILLLGAHLNIIVGSPFKLVGKN